MPSSPSTLLGYIAARTETLLLSTSTTLITTNDPVKIAEDFAMLQHLSGGRIDLTMGRGNTGPVYAWFGRDVRQGIELSVENYALLRRLWREEAVDWDGRFRTPLQSFTSTPRPLDGTSPVRLARLDPLASGRRAGGLLRRRVHRQQHLWPKDHTRRMVDPLPVPLRPLRPRQRRAGDRRAGWPRVHAAELAGRGPRVPAVLRRGARLRPRSVNEEFMEQTPLVVGSPAQVVDRILSFREYAGDYQRQLFLLDHAGLPLKTVLEQIDLLGEEVVPMLRKEFARGRSPLAPDAPTHTRRSVCCGRRSRPERNRGGRPGCSSGRPPKSVPRRLRPGTRRGSRL